MSESTLFPSTIPNWIDGNEKDAISCSWVDKYNPHDGQVLSQLARSGAEDVAQAVATAKAAQLAWAAVPAVRASRTDPMVAMRD